MTMPPLPLYDHWQSDPYGDLVKLSYTDDAMHAYAKAYAAQEVAVERERCNELIADAQVYPTDDDCKVLNPVLHELMKSVDSGMNSREWYLSRRAQKIRAT